MGIIPCSIVSKDIPENKVKQLPTILKRETVERKDSIKLNWYQQKDISLLSKKKKILNPLKDIKEKMVVFKTVPNVDLLRHASEIFHKADRQRPRPNWNGLMDHLNSEKTKKKVSLQCYQ